MQTNWVELDVTGEKMPCFVAEPGGAPRGGVIVIQEIFGVNADMQRIGELVASDGYLAVVPALFHRTDPQFEASHDEAGFAKGRAASSAIDGQQLVADLTAASDYLYERLGADARVATWGFCFGGSIAYMSATLPFVDAAVSFYGAQIAQSPGPNRPALVELTPQIHAPLLLAFGGRDPYIPPEDVETIREALDEHHKSFDLLVYAGEDHGFFREGPTGSQGAAQAWARVQAFLASHLTAS